MTLLTTDAAMYALAPEWAELWSRTNATPFQHPAWLLPWWSAFGTGLQRVAILRDGDRLIGVLPLYERLDEAKLFPMGAGITDYQDVLLDPLAPPDAAEMLLATALRDTALPAHLIDLPPWSPLRDCGTDRNSTLSPADPCPVLDPTRISARQLRKLRMSRDRANRAGGATIQIATPATAVRMFADLSDLYALRWRERGEGGVLADPAVAAFHAAALPGLMAAGLLWLCALSLNGRVAAVIYALCDRDRILFHLSGQDELRAFESPGTLLLGWMLEHAGGREAHFLRGAEAYKYAWGAIDTFNAQRVLTRP